MLHSFFDNTISVKREAQKAAYLLNDESGNETALYKIGQKVDGNGLGFSVGEITDVYGQNGYVRYIITYKISPRARKVYQKTLRQQDIKIIK